MSHTQEATDDPFLDEEWLATQGAKSRWRIVLWAALAVAVVFLAGAQVQKHFGTSSSTATAGAPAFPGGQGLPAGFPALSGAGAPQPSSAASDTAQPAASLIGTVIRVTGNTLQVKDFGGTTHTIAIGAHTTITRLATLHASDLEPGSTVVIEQGSGSSKHRPATAITVR
jgi:hypothetical protein